MAEEVKQDAALEYDDDTRDDSVSADAGQQDIFDVDDEPMPSTGEPDSGDAGDTDAEAEDSRSKGHEDTSPADAAEPQTVQPKGLDPQLVAAAKMAGLNDEDIAAFPSEAALDRTLASLARRGLLGQGKPREASPTPEAAKPQAQEVQAETKAHRYELPKELDEYDEQIVKVIRGMNEHYAAQLEALAAKADKADKIEQAWTAQQQESQRSQMMRDIEWFDTKIAGLGEEFQELFGKGDTLSLEPGEALTHRDEVFSQMLALAKVYRDTGLRMPSPDVLFDRAFHSVHGKTINQKAKQSARQEINKALQEQSKAAMGRPAVRNGTGRSKGGLDAGLEFQKKFFAERGLKFEGDDEDDRDAFLD